MSRAVDAGAKGKTYTVRVRLIAECEVTIQVDAADDEDPCDLTKAEEREAIAAGESFPQWEVDDVELLG